MARDLLYRVIEPFVIYGENGNRETFALSNEVFEANHPAVIKRPGSFEVVTPRGVATASKPPAEKIETATKAPGEKRAVTPPKSRGRRGRAGAGDVETATSAPGKKRGSTTPNAVDIDDESRASSKE